MYLKPLYRVAGLILQKGLREFVAFPFAQGTDDLPSKEDRYLHRAGAGVVPFGLPPPHQTRYIDLMP